MIKLFATALTFTATIGLAQAQPLPAPPTEVYSAPVTNACDDQSLQIYFSEGESALNASSQALLEEVQARLEGCIVGAVQLEANALDARSKIAAEKLAVARLESVAAALETYELSGMQLQARYDESFAPSALRSPKLRAVEIHMSAWAPEIG